MAINKSKFIFSNETHFHGASSCSMFISINCHENQCVSWIRLVKIKPSIGRDSRNKKNVV